MALDGTYSGLLSSLADWLMRDDLTARIPDFVSLSHARINVQLRVRQMEATTTLTPTAGVCTLPTDYIEARRVVSNVDPASDLTQIGLDAAREQYSTAGYPRFYAIQGSSLLVIPSSTATITLDYYAQIPALSVTNPTNWLLTKLPQAYLYGSLMEAAPFLEDDNRLVTWAQLYKASVEDLLKEDQRASFGKAVSRVKGCMP